MCMGIGTSIPYPLVFPSVPTAHSSRGSQRVVPAVLVTAACQMLTPSPGAAWAADWLRIRGSYDPPTPHLRFD